MILKKITPTLKERWKTLIRILMMNCRSLITSGDTEQNGKSDPAQPNQIHSTPSNDVDGIPVPSNENPKIYKETNSVQGVSNFVNEASEISLLLTVFSSSDEEFSDNDSDSGRTNESYSNKREPESNEGSVEPYKKVENSKSITDQPNAKQKKKRRKIFVECEICRRSLLKKYLKKHLQHHSSERNFECEICLKKFKTADNLKVHLTVHMQKEDIICSFCQKLYSSEAALKVHQKRHSQESLYKCSFCSKGFHTKFHLKTHENEHTAEKVYVCDVCKAQYVSYAGFQCHKKKHKDTLYICDVCCKTFRRIDVFKNHQQTHNKDSPVNVCYSCGKSFSCRKTLNDHIRIHTGEKPYVCEVCGKRSRTHELNTQHARTHSGEKPYTCNICNKGFSQRTSLVIHQRSHTGERPYKCELCSKSFTSNSGLHIHSKQCRS